MFRVGGKSVFVGSRKDRLILYQSEKKFPTFRIV